MEDRGSRLRGGWAIVRHHALSRRRRPTPSLTLNMGSTRGLVAPPSPSPPIPTPISIVQRHSPFPQISPPTGDQSSHKSYNSGKARNGMQPLGCGRANNVHPTTLVSQIIGDIPMENATAQLATAPLLSPISATIWQLAISSDSPSLSPHLCHPLVALGSSRQSLPFPHSCHLLAAHHNSR